MNRSIFVSVHNNMKHIRQACNAIELAFSKFAKLDLPLFGQLSKILEIEHKSFMTKGLNVLSNWLNVNVSSLKEDYDSLVWNGS